MELRVEEMLEERRFTGLARTGEHRCREFLGSPFQNRLQRSLDVLSSHDSPPLLAIMHFKCKIAR
jgi:hypothetical protein